MSETPLTALLVQEHRKVVSEFSGNLGGHVAIRDGWVEYDEDTAIENCEVCDALLAARSTAEGLREALTEISKMAADIHHLPIVAVARDALATSTPPSPTRALSVDLTCP